MARGRPRKKIEPDLKTTMTLNGKEITGEGPFEFRTGPPELKKEPEQPEKEDFVTPFEAARILNLDEHTIKLYYDNGILTGKGQYGNIRISRGSLFGARIKKLISGPMG
jgi:hypothetical protein